ncbi:MAG: Transposase family protein [Gemmataceae bacterium]|nr:Transposase family protein [Gemmataceae bacterium]
MPRGLSLRPGRDRAAIRRGGRVLAPAGGHPGGSSRTGYHEYSNTSGNRIRGRRTAHGWVYGGEAGNPYLVCDLSVGQSGGAPATVLKAYKGFVHADGYAGYNPVYEGGVTLVGCGMPARRYFLDARVSVPERAHEALARIRARSTVEQAAKEYEAKIRAQAQRSLKRRAASLGYELVPKAEPASSGRPFPQ